MRFPIILILKHVKAKAVFIEGFIICFISCTDSDTQGAKKHPALL